MVNLGLLSYFKYAGFFVAQINSMGRAAGFEELAWEGPILPIGISFFVFQSMSYTIDMWRGRFDRIHQRGRRHERRSYSDWR